MTHWATYTGITNQSWDRGLCNVIVISIRIADIGGGQVQMCSECQVEARAMLKDLLLRFSPTSMYEKVVDSLINLFATRKPNQSLWTDCGTACTESNCSIQQLYASTVSRQQHVSIIYAGSNCCKVNILWHNKAFIFLFLENMWWRASMLFFDLRKHSKWTSPDLNHVPNNLQAVRTHSFTLT